MVTAMVRPLALLAARLSDIRLLRYVAASIGALAVDVGVFLTCLALGMAAGPAAACGYGAGIVAHWLLSSRAVFHNSIAAGGSDRLVQKSMFVMSALAGLGLTTLIVTLAHSAGGDPRIAKMAAIVASFALTYILRSRVVFKGSAK